MAGPPSTPPPRTAQGCRLSSRLVAPKLLLDTAHRPLPLRHWQAWLLGFGFVPPGGGGAGLSRDRPA